MLVMWVIIGFLLIILFAKLVFSCVELKECLCSTYGQERSVALDGDLENQRTRGLSTSDRTTVGSATFPWIANYNSGVFPSESGPPTYSECGMPPKYEEAVKKCMISGRIIDEE